MSILNDLKKGYLEFRKTMLRKAMASGDLFFSFDHFFLENLIKGVSDRVSVMFVDIAGFTRFARGKRPAAVVKTLNEIFEEICPVIYRRHGIVDKFIGDEVLAIFGGPFRRKKEKGDRDGFSQALRASVEILGHFEQKRWPRVKVGLNYGPAYLGVVGRKVHRKLYGELTVVGDTVNLAKRFEETAEGGELILPFEERSRRSLAGVLPEGFIALHENVGIGGRGRTHIFRVRRETPLDILLKPITRPIESGRAPT